VPNETDRDKVIDKVIKLHAHAESAKALGNEEEAEAFAAKVQELLTAYKLSQSDLRDKSKVVEEPINVTKVRFDNRTGSRVAWSEHLAGIVCPAYYCKFFVLTGTNALGVIGQETDRQVCCFMLVTLARLIVKIANKENRAYRIRICRTHPDGDPVTGKIPPECHGFKADFIAGFLKRLYERFQEEINPKTPNANTQAIVLVRRDTLARVDQWSKANLALKDASHTHHGFRPMTEGYRRGMEAANDLNLKPNVVKGGGQAPKELR
jgi:hypothetical protein